MATTTNTADRRSNATDSPALRITPKVGEMLDGLITVAYARDLMEEMFRADGRDPAELDGPDFQDALFTIRISGLDLNGSESPENHLRNMCRYAYLWGYRPVDVCFERQSGFKLTEPKNLHLRYRDGKPVRRRRHAKNYDRKRWLERYEAMVSGDLRVAAVLCHSMDRFARREGTGQMWLDFMKPHRIKMVETRNLREAPRFLHENNDKLYGEFMKALSAAREYSTAVAGKVGDSFDAKAERGEATYPVGNYFGHDHLWSDELDEPRLNKHGRAYRCGGRRNVAEAEVLNFAARHLMATKNRGGTVRATNDAGYRSRSGEPFTIAALLDGNLASPRMIGYQTRGDWEPHHEAERATSGCRRYGDQRIVPCELIEPILDMTVEEWEQMCDLIYQRADDGRRNPSKWPLSGFGKCGGKNADGSPCGCNMTGVKTDGREPILRCGRPRDYVTTCDCGKPDGRCVCLRARRAQGLTHPTIDMKLGARVLVEATLLSYDTQRVARRATELLGDDDVLTQQIAALQHKTTGFKAAKARIRESNNAGLYDTSEEFHAAVAEVQRMERENDAAIAQLRARLKRVQATEVDANEMRNEIEISMAKLVEQAAGVMDGFTVLPSMGWSNEEARIVVHWKDGCAPSAEAWEALCNELAARRITARSASARKARGTCLPEVSEMIWLLWGQGKASNEIVHDLRQLNMPMAKSEQTGKGRDIADMQFVRQEVKHLCHVHGEEYVARRNYRGRRKYPLELGRRIYEMCKTGHKYQTIARALTQDGVEHPDGLEWTATIVSRIYGAECSVRGHKPGRRANTSDETRALVWADHQMGTTPADIAAKLNSDGVRRWSRKPWTARAVRDLLAYERRRMEAEGLIEKRRGPLPKEYARKFVEMHAAGMTYASIAVWANDAGIKRRYGSGWDAASVECSAVYARKALNAAA